MDFDDLVDVFSVFRKLHTSNIDKDKTIFYRDLDSRKGVMKINSINGDDIFDLQLVSHMSLSSYDGLLVQYDTLDGRKMYPYRLHNIYSVEIEFTN